MKPVFVPLLSSVLILSFLSACSKEASNPVTNIYKTYKFDQGAPSYSIDLYTGDDFLRSYVNIAPCNIVPHVTIDNLPFSFSSMEGNMIKMQRNHIPKKDEYTFTIEMDSLYSERIVKRVKKPATAICGNKTITINDRSSVDDSIQKQANANFSFSGGQWTELRITCNMQDSLYNYSSFDTTIQQNPATFSIPTKNYTRISFEIYARQKDFPTQGTIPRQGDFLTGTVISEEWLSINLTVK